MYVNNMKPLTPRQKKVLDFINTFSEENGYSPSLSEIAKFIGKAISTAQHFVAELQSKGYLQKEENVARGISSVIEQNGRIFLLGIIAAGEPIEPLENPEPIDVPLEMISGLGDYYALKVKGDSMIDDGIENGDTVVIKQQNFANSGDRVVAITENGATSKVYRKNLAKTFLEPRNKNLKNIYPKELEIRGKFVGLIRKN